MSLSPEAGVVLDGRYLLRAPLGRGGMGTVWRAEHVTLRSDVAIKLLAPAISASVEGVERFRREAQLAAALDSANIVRTIDFGVSDGTAYIAMELLQGETLGARLARRGALPAAETMTVLGQIARGVGRAHEASVVHCDLKPENVFIARVDGEDVAKVLDFGVAKALALDPLTQTGAVLGTFQYMSPEQLRGRRQVDHRSDLYSLAVIAFECLCGLPAFRGDSIGELVTQICVEPLPVPSRVAPVPPAFDAWFARAADRDPAQRFGSAKELASALANVLGDAGAWRTSVPPTSTRALAPTQSLAFSAGTERAGYRLRPDVARRVLELELWGMWELDVARSFRTDVLASFRAMAGAPWVALGNGTRHPPQRPDVQAIESETMGLAAKYGMVRTALVIESALARMSAQRLAGEAAMPNTRFFDSEPEARTWLADTAELARPGGDSNALERRGGDERAGYRITPDLGARVLEIENWGMWDVPLAQAWRSDMQRAFDRMAGTPFSVLALSARNPVQSSEVQNIRLEAMKSATAAGVVRRATIVDSALTTMQLRRLHTEAGALDTARFFRDEHEARAWLAELRTR